MKSVAYQFTSLCHFDKTAGVHHSDAAGDVSYHRQVVRNEQIAEFSLRLQPFQQIDDLALIGKVQCGDHLITYDELRIQGEGPGNAHPLLLTSGQFRRIAVCMVRTESYLMHKAGGQFLQFLL